MVSRCLLRLRFGRYLISQAVAASSAQERVNGYTAIDSVARAPSVIKQGAPRQKILHRRHPARAGGVDIWAG